MSSAISIRLARPGDASRLAELLAGGALTDGQEDPADVAAYADALADIDADPDAEVLVAELDGAVVAMCQLIMFRQLQRRGGRCAEIESVHVAAEHRGRGIGGRLLEEAVARAAARGCYRVQLTSDRSRTDTPRFYERHGFTASHVGFKRWLD